MKRCIFFVSIFFLLNLATVLCQKKIICYYGTWATYRHGNGAFNVHDIDPFLCTHYIYSFFGINTDGTIKVLDPYLDLEENYGRGNIKKFISLKHVNPNVKLLAAVGGWNEGSAKFSTVAADAGKRAKFAESTAAFCKKHGFDGLDMDWEYPAQRDGHPGDKRNFVLMLKDLHSRFVRDNLLLTAAVAAAEHSSAISYDIPNIARYLDMIHLMSYDFHGAWEPRLGHNAPLYESLVDVTSLQRQLNVKASVNYWLSQGAPKEKLILGIPLYGRTFTLRDQNHNKVGDFHSGPGISGPYTNQPGMMGYNEICEKQKTHHWLNQWDKQQKVPYTQSGNQWITYDNEESVGLKTKIAHDLGLGGAMVWSIETDDFRGLCFSKKYPLMKSIKKVLHGSTPPITSSLASTTVEVLSTTLIDINSSNPNLSTLGSETSSSGSFTTIANPFVCKSNGIHRDTNDCSGFYICSNLTPYHFRCPTPLVFDDTQKKCNWSTEASCSL